MMLKNGHLIFQIPPQIMNKKLALINLHQLLLKYSPKAKFGIETINIKEHKKIDDG